MIHGKTEKQIIWDTIRHIEEKAPKNGYLDITNTYWKAYSKEEKILLRKLLVLNKLVRLGDNQQWSFQLTGEAIVAEKNDFNDDGKLKDKDQSYRRAIYTTLIGVGAGVILSTASTIGIEVWKAKHQQIPQTNIVVRPTIQIHHDTIWLKGAK